MVRASGETLGGLRRSDAFDVVLDDRDRVTALVLEVRRGDDARPQLLDEVWQAARLVLLRGAELQDVAGAVVAETRRVEGAELGFAVVRVCQTGSRVEVLNAGMPAIACATPARTFLHPAMSGAIGRRDERAHAYETVSLIWGSTWLLASSGLTSGSLAADATRALCRQLDFVASGMALAASSSDQLRDRILACQPDANGPASNDGTLVVIGADPHARLLHVR